MMQTEQLYKLLIMNTEYRTEAQKCIICIFIIKILFVFPFSKVWVESPVEKPLVHFYFCFLRFLNKLSREGTDITNQQDASVWQTHCRLHYYRGELNFSAKNTTRRRLVIEETIKEQDERYIKAPIISNRCHKIKLHPENYSNIWLHERYIMEH